MEQIEASKLLDRSREASDYSKKLLVMIQGIFRTKKINRYDYEKMINILSCQMLMTEDIELQLLRYIDNESAKKLRFDVRV